MILLIGILASTTAMFCGLMGDFSWQNILVGSVITGVLMWVFRRQITPRPLAPIGLSVHLLLYSPVLVYYLLVDIIKGTFQVAMITMGLQPLVKPGIVKIPLKAHSPYGVGPVGFFITLSPGTFLVDIDWDEKAMLVHAIDASNPEQIRREAEKYYRLWEYGLYLPREDADDAGEGASHA